MTAVGSGIATQVVARNESTYGVVPSLASVRSYEIRSETLELRKTTVQGEGLHAGGYYTRTKRRVLTNYDVQGGIVLDLPYRQLAFWIQHCVGSFGQANATPTQIGGSGVYRSVHQPGLLTGNSFVLQKGVPAVDGTVMPMTYCGGKITDWELKVSTGAIAELTLTMDARNELGGTGNSDPLNVSVPTLATWGPPATGVGMGIFHFRQATIFTGGTPTLGADAVFGSNVLSLAGATAAANVKDVSVKHSAKFDSARYFLGSSGFKAEPIENAFRSITGALSVEWLSSAAMYNAFANDTTTSLQVTLTGPSVSGQTYLVDVIIPNIKLDGESPKVPGPAVISQAVTFTGLDDETTVPIQVAYQSEDAAI